MENCPAPDCHIDLTEKVTSASSKMNVILVCVIFALGGIGTANVQMMNMKTDIAEIQVNKEKISNVEEDQEKQRMRVDAILTQLKLGVPVEQIIDGY